MEIINMVLVGAENYTLGSQTFYGIPRLTTLPVALVCALAAITIARLSRESVPGICLRACREDELASRSFGTDIWKPHLQAFVLSIMICAVAGTRLVHFVTAFSPRAIYFTMTLSYLVVVIIGGGSTIIGPVRGAVLVVAVTELLRPVESGLYVAMLVLVNFFRLSPAALAVTMLLVRYFQREGLIGLRELVEIPNA